MLSPLHCLLGQEDLNFEDVCDLVGHHDQEHPLQQSCDASDDKDRKSDVGFTAVVTITNKLVNVEEVCNR